MCKNCFNIYSTWIPQDVTDVAIQAFNGVPHFYAKHSGGLPFAFLWEPNQFKYFFYHWYHAPHDDILKFKAQAIYEMKVMNLARWNDFDTFDLAYSGVTATRAVMKADKRLLARMPPSHAPLDSDLSEHFAKQVAAAKRFSASRAVEKPRAAPAFSVDQGPRGFLQLLYKEKTPFLPGDFPYFRHATSEKQHEAFLPCDFFKFKEIFYEDQEECFLPCNFYRFKEMFSESRHRSFLPIDFYKFKEIFREESPESFLPIDFYKYKEYTNDEQSLEYLPRDFFKYIETVYPKCSVPTFPRISTSLKTPSRRYAPPSSYLEIFHISRSFSPRTLYRNAMLVPQRVSTSISELGSSFSLETSTVSSEPGQKMTMSHSWVARA